MVADKLSKAGWSLGWVSAVDSEGRTLWIVDAHRDNGKRFVVRSDEMLGMCWQYILEPSPPSFRRCQHEHDPTAEKGSSGYTQWSAVDH
jgi:hypothetical protein